GNYSGELRNFLKQHLPEYMIPSVFVTVDALPLTANGKVDRSALPAANAATANASEEFVAPRTPTEKVLHDIWANVLQIARIGVDQNFFDLGGHSLIATRILSQIREMFPVDLSIRNLFESPTIAALAACVDQAPAREAALEQLPIVRRRN